MFSALSFPLPWRIGRPRMGSMVVGVCAGTNKHLGINGSYVQFIGAARRRRRETRGRVGLHPINRSTH